MLQLVTQNVLRLLYSVEQAIFITHESVLY